MQEFLENRFCVLWEVCCMKNFVITNNVKVSAVSNKNVKFAQINVSVCSLGQTTCV